MYPQLQLLYLYFATQLVLCISVLYCKVLKFNRCHNITIIMGMGLGMRLQFNRESSDAAIFFCAHKNNNVVLELSDFWLLLIIAYYIIGVGN